MQATVFQSLDQTSGRFAMKVDPKLDTLRADRRTAALFASLYPQRAAARVDAGPRIRRVVSGNRS